MAGLLAGEAALEQGDAPAALDAARALLAAEPLSPAALLLAGRALLAMGQTARAQGALRAALAVRPDMPELHFALGVRLPAALRRQCG